MIKQKWKKGKRTREIYIEREYERKSERAGMSNCKAHELTPFPPFSTPTTKQKLTSSYEATYLFPEGLFCIFKNHFLLSAFTGKQNNVKMRFYDMRSHTPSSPSHKKIKLKIISIKKYKA